MEQLQQILNYFPGLNEEQIRQLSSLEELYTDWNSKINVISRKDIGNLYEHHVLHSLGIAKVIRFREGIENGRHESVEPPEVSTYILPYGIETQPGCHASARLSESLPQKHLAPPA